MAETPDRLRQILERIRNDTEQALTLLRDGAGEERALGWKCKGCGYIKHFTKPVSLEAVARCPRCKSDQFVPVA
jgi:predicted Zn-ribbon and HTH transcriptional regulator